PRTPLKGLSVSVQPARATRGLSGSKRYVVLHSLPHVSDLVDQIGQIFRAAHKIHFGAVDHQQGRFIVIKEKVSICLRDTLNVFWRNAPLVLAVALAQPLHQYIATGLKIYDQIRFWQARTEERKELAIERQFVGFEVGLGKDLILGKQVVGDRVLIEQ